MSVAANGGNLYLMRKNGSIWRFTGTPCSSNVCPGWQQLDNNARNVGITGGSGNLCQLHNNLLLDSDRNVVTQHNDNNRTGAYKGETVIDTRKHSRVRHAC